MVTNYIIPRLKETDAHSSDLSRRDVITFPLSATFYFEIRLSTFTLCSCGAPANFRSFSTPRGIRTLTYYLRMVFETIAFTDFAIGVFNYVTSEGVEPSILSAYAPKAYVYSSSTN